MIDYGSYQTLIVEKANKVATITLNRPERLNAVNDVLHNELEDIFGRINGDHDVNAIILTGAGRAFCAGGDITGFSSSSESEDGASGAPVTFSRGPRRLILNMLEVEAPIITAVNGPAVGLGATLALFGDVIIASEQAGWISGQVFAVYGDRVFLTRGWHNAAKIESPGKGWTAEDLARAVPKLAGMAPVPMIEQLGFG